MDRAALRIDVLFWLFICEANLFGLRGAQEDMRVQENSLTAYLDEVRDGLPLSREGACLLLRCPEDELPALLAAALELKQRFKPGVIT